MGERAGGVGRYARELPGALLAAEPATEVVVFVSPRAPDDLRAESWADSVRWSVPSVPRRVPALGALVQAVALPALARAKGLDVLHSPANVGPVITPGVASVVSLHDLIWLHRASEWDASLRAQRSMLRAVRHSVRHADRVLAVSHAAAQDFVRTLGLDPACIVVAHHGVHAPRAVTAAARAAMRERLQLGDARVLLCVAQKRPYKNLHTLVRALPGLPTDVVLVLPGSPTPYEGELRALARELAVDARVRFPDWLSDDDLDALYALSDAFALPSLIEGFGMPVLEAMARGLPVACSEVSALPEVAGDAAVLFDPTHQADVTAAVRSLFEDGDLVARLSVRGRERAAEFTWRRAGEATLSGYREAIAAHRGTGFPAAIS